MPKRKPVADSVVDATLKHLPPVVADMVQIQRVTAMRPGEVFSMTWDKIDQTDDVWIYYTSHKAEHHGIIRPVPLPKSCQVILEKYRDTHTNGLIFSPRRTLIERAEMRSANRKTKITPSQLERMKKQLRAYQYANESYNRYSNRTAIQRAAQKAGVEKWCPYQLRHTGATTVAHSLSKEDARLLLGHTSLVTTEIYVAENIEKLKEIARKMDNQKSGH